MTAPLIDGGSCAFDPPDRGAGDVAPTLIPLPSSVQGIEAGRMGGHRRAARVRLPRARDARAGLHAVLATLAGGLSPREGTSLRGHLERALCQAVGARAVRLQVGRRIVTGPSIVAADEDAVDVAVPTGAGVLRVVVSPLRPLDAWDTQLLESGAALAAVIIDFERALLAAPRATRPMHDVPGLVGSSSVMQALRDRIERVARTDFAVLVEGESGVGKELVARQVHALSRRARGPFIAVNCAAIVDTLVEAELFGIEDRAATGVKGRRGKFELADGGTLFLDEIADLSSAAQAKLLRALQDLSIDRIGSQAAQRVDVRVIAASNRDLDREVTEGRFRRDLFYRLQVFPIRVPPLRERVEDIPALVAHFLRRHCVDLKRPVPRVAPQAMRALQELEYPGNVRELGNLIERALINAAPGEPLSAEHLLDVRPERRVPPPTSEDATLDGQLARAERAFIERALGATGGNKTAAARELGVTYRGLIKKMKRLGMPVGVTDDGD